MAKDRLHYRPAPIRPPCAAARRVSVGPSVLRARRWRFRAVHGPRGGTLVRCKANQQRRSGLTPAAPVPTSRFGGGSVGPVELAIRGGAVGSAWGRGAPRRGHQESGASRAVCRHLLYDATGTRGALEGTRTSRASLVPRGVRFVSTSRRRPCRGHGGGSRAGRIALLARDCSDAATSDVPSRRDAQTKFCPACPWSAR